MKMLWDLHFHVLPTLMLPLGNVESAMTEPLKLTVIARHPFYYMSR